MDTILVTIKVKTSASKSVYIVGSTVSIGSWNPARAIALDKDEEGFYIKKEFFAGEMVEFKLLADKDWSKVEKGYYGEEIKNHILTPSKDLEVEIEIPRFN